MDNIIQVKKECFNEPYCEISNICKQLHAKEQECEELKLDLIEAKAHSDYLNNLALSKTLDTVSDELDQLKSELKSAKELREYTYDCCKQAGEELAKNSFEWDGKEKNLVVQAMELNERYDQLKVENEELKFQNKRLDEVTLYWHKRIFKVERSERKLKQTLAEIKEIAEEARTKVFVDMEEFWKQILQKISEVEDADKT